LTAQGTRAGTSAVGEFLDRLPAIVRTDEVQGEHFLRRFLRAFADIYAGVQGEIDTIPDLFALTPTPVLAAPAGHGAQLLELDSAAGLCSGDLLVLNPLPGPSEMPVPDPAFPVEIVRVAGIADPAPRRPASVALAAPTRSAHPKGVRVVALQWSNRAAPSGTVLAQPVSPSSPQRLAVIDAAALSASRGDVVAVSEGRAVEHAQVARVDGVELTVVPPFRHSHEAGRPVVIVPRAATSTPPSGFGFADRHGPQVVLLAPVRQGDVVISLDALSGTVVGDVLHLRDPDPAKVEFVRVVALPQKPSTAVPFWRYGVTVSPPARFDHPAGLPIGVLGGEGGPTVLAQAITAGAAVLEVADPVDLRPGSVLRVGSTEHVQVVAVSSSTVFVTPAIQVGHAAGEPVLPVGPAGSGTAYLDWLAGWIGLALRPGRGERWNRELIRLVGRILPWRGTRVGLEAFLAAYLAGEVERLVVHDTANPMQLGLVSTLGDDTVVCGSPPGYFWVDIETEPGNGWLYHPQGLDAVVQAAHEALRHERPAHTYSDLRVSAQSMQLGTDPARQVGARVGDTTLLWDRPAISRGDR
jgi:hypothetical protein